jgi:hypothetical protein
MPHPFLTTSADFPTSICALAEAGSHDSIDTTAFAVATSKEQNSTTTAPKPRMTWASWRSHILKQFRAAVPPTGYDAFLVISVLAILIVAAGTVPPAHKLWQSSGRTWEWILEGVAWCVDPILFNFIGAVVCGYLVYRGAGVSTNGIPPLTFAWRCVFTISIPLIVFAFGIVLDVLVLNHSFSASATREAAHEGFITVWLKPFLQRQTGLEANAVGPSPACFIQTLLFLCGLVYLRTLRHRSHKRVAWRELFRGEKIALLFLAAGCLLLPMQRVVRGFNSIADVALCFGLASYFFWTGFYVITRLLKRFHPSSTSGLVGITLLNVPIFMYLAKDTFWWIVIFVAMTAVLGLVHMVSGDPVRPVQPEVFRDPLIAPSEAEPKRQI